MFYQVNKLRRRESCEQFELDHAKQSESGRTSPETLAPDQLPSRPSSALARLTENAEDSVEDELESGESASELRHKRVHEEEEEEEDSGRRPLLGRFINLRPDLPRPIITITEDR